jgi:5-methylcytosine-specific restriction endonuclease McrA
VRENLLWGMDSSASVKPERAIKRAKRAANPAPHRERARQWQLKHPEKTTQARRRWREAHRAIEQERAKARRLANFAEFQQKNSRYYSINKEGLLQKQQQRRAEHPERNREQVRQWRKRYPDKLKAQRRRRRALKFNTPGAHSEAEWRALKARYDHRCLRCGRREPEVFLTRDHVIPLGEPGASDRIDNIQPLCGRCNAWKGRRALDYRVEALPVEA